MLCRHHANDSIESHAHTIPEVAILYLPHVNQSPVSIGYPMTGLTQILRHANAYGEIIARADRNDTHRANRLAVPGRHHTVKHLVGGSISRYGHQQFISVRHGFPCQFHCMARSFGQDDVELQAIFRQILADFRQYPYGISASSSWVYDE